MYPLVTCLMKVAIFSQSLESISKELVAKLQTRLAHWDVNTTLIGDVLVEMVGNLTHVSTCISEFILLTIFFTITLLKNDFLDIQL